VAAFYSHYLGVGGYNIADFYLYDSWQNNIKGFSFDFYDGRVRSGMNLDGMLSVNSNSTKLSESFWRLIPLRTIKSTAFTPSIMGKVAYTSKWDYWENLWELQPSSSAKTFSGWNISPDGSTLNGVKATDIPTSMFWRQKFAAYLLGDAITVDMFSAELSTYTGILWNMMDTGVRWADQGKDPYTGQPIYDKRGKLDRDNDDIIRRRAKYYLQYVYRTYRNVVKTAAHGKYHWNYKINEPGYSYYLGDYEMPLGQIMLAMWMSGDLGKIRGEKLSGDPTKGGFNSKNHPHRFNHQREAFRTMRFTKVDATKLVRSWTSFTFQKFIPDAYHIDNGTYSHIGIGNLYQFKVNNPFSGLSITRSLKNGFSDNSLSGY
jgi:hypothetical protein